MILTAENISKNFRRIRRDSNILTAVQPVSLVLEPGNIYVVHGRSGSGKSTLLNMLAGLLAPTDGTVLLGGKDLYALEDRELSAIRNQCMGFLPQGQTAIHTLTVLENVLVPYTLHGKNAILKEKSSKKGHQKKVTGNICLNGTVNEIVTDCKTCSEKNPENDSKTDSEYISGNNLQKENAAETFQDILARAHTLLERLGIAELEGVRPSELSGGELRRMAIARSLIHQPAFLFADEPTGDLDSSNTQEVMRLLRELADKGMVIFLVTHDTEAFPFADRIYEMNDGLLAEGTATAI